MLDEVLQSLEDSSPNIAQPRQTSSNLACMSAAACPLPRRLHPWLGRCGVPPILDHDSDFLHSSAQLQLSPARGGEGRGGALTQILFALFSSSDAASAVCRYQAAIISVASFYSISNELCRHLDILPHTLNSNEVSSTETCQTCLLLLRCRAAQH